MEQKWDRETYQGKSQKQIEDSQRAVLYCVMALGALIATAAVFYGADYGLSLLRAALR